MLEEWCVILLRVFYTLLKKFGRDFRVRAANISATCFMYIVLNMFS